MATRFYFSADPETTPIQPTPSTQWETTTGFERVGLSTSIRYTDHVTGIFSDSNQVDRDCLLRQYISYPLTTGLIVNELQSVKGQFRCNEPNAGNNMFLAIGIRIISGGGTIVRKTLVPVTRGGSEFSDGAPLVNRSFAETTASGDYTVQAGDRLVVEVGAGGDPGGAGSSHSYRIRFGDKELGDLPEDQANQNDLNPWLEFPDQTLTFVSGESPRAMHQYRQRRV